MCAVVHEYSGSITNACHVLIFLSLVAEAHTSNQWHVLTLPVVCCFCIMQDCLELNRQTGGALPILFDTFHHQCLGNGESILSAMKKAAATWRLEDGLPMVRESGEDLRIKHSFFERRM